MAAVVNNLSQKIREITIPELEKKVESELEKIQPEIIEHTSQNREELIKRIQVKIRSFTKAVTAHQKQLDIIGRSGGYDRISKSTQEVYSRFFELQNLINTYLSQRIIVTYVHVDKNGEREIRLYNNNSEHLRTRRNEAKYSFKNRGYQLLRTTLPKDSKPEKDLQNTAKEVEKRYNASKQHIVQWTTKGGGFAGYKLQSKGPINEAFVNFYVNTLADDRPHYFSSPDKDGNVKIYALHNLYGMVQADTENGFLVGDVSAGGKIQYAVKGRYAAAQRYKTIFEFFNTLDKEFNSETADDILNDLAIQLKKGIAPLGKKMSQRAIEELIE